VSNPSPKSVLNLDKSVTVYISLFLIVVEEVSKEVISTGYIWCVNLSYTISSGLIVSYFFQFV
jgi:hypothetical protein